MKHRRIISLLSAVITGLSAAAIPLASDFPVNIVAEAATLTYGDFECSYEPGTNEATIVKYRGNKTDVTIPSTIITKDGKKRVTKIADEAFTLPIKGNSRPGPKNITSVTFETPSYVKEIGKRAFYQAPLKELVLPSSVKTIDEEAFYECNAMKTLKIEGAAEIRAAAFYCCSSLYGVWLNENCDSISKDDSPFDGCKELEFINGSRVYTTSFDQHGWNKPTLTTNKKRKIIITNLFKNARQVKFIDSYCNTLCRYVVDSETRSWMSEEIKARQLYVWLINHCEYEDNDSDKSNADNHIYSSAFLSYGLNERGSGIGETICEGFSKAYSMLLTAAGIESYVLVANNKTSGEEGHAWNIINVNKRYYQCDVTADNSYYNKYGTKGLYFMRTATDMDNLHGNQYYPPSIDSTDIVWHNLLNYDDSTGNAALNQCNTYFYDTAIDGIRDSDFNFDGVVNAKDTQILQKICSGDMTLDGKITAIDNQLFNEFCAVNPNDAHEYWLNLCIQYDILGK